MKYNRENMIHFLEGLRSQTVYREAFEDWGAELGGMF